MEARSIDEYQLARNSGWEGDKQKFSGHKTQSQVTIYDRKVPVVGTHECRIFVTVDGNTVWIHILYILRL